MRIRSLLLAAAAAAAFAAPAAAAVSVNVHSYGNPTALPDGQVLVADFNTPATPEAVLLAGYELDLDGATVGVNEGGSGYSGTLPNNPTNYLTIPGGADATLTSLKGIRSFSLYMGSPDTYNSIQFIGKNGFNQTLSGGQLSAGDTNQQWSWGARVNFNFGDAEVTQVILRSSQNSFESDNFAVAAVPEPATWAMMIMGFGAMGALLRRRQYALARI
jgi:opacity protein-like surface antigen